MKPPKKEDKIKIPAEIELYYMGHYDLVEMRCRTCNKIMCGGYFLHVVEDPNRKWYHNDLEERASGRYNHHFKHVHPYKTGKQLTIKF